MKLLCTCCHYLKARDDTQVCLAIWTVVLGFPSQNPATAIVRVPTIIAPKGSSCSQYWAVAVTWG